MDAFSKVQESILVQVRTILGSPNPEFSNSVTLFFEPCGENLVTVRGLNPDSEQVFKTLNCDEVTEIINLSNALQQFAGAE